MYRTMEKYKAIRGSYYRELSSETYLIGSINLCIEANLLTMFSNTITPGLSKINTYLQEIPSCNGYSQETENGKRKKGETEKEKSQFM